MFETRLGILVQTLIWETSKHGQRGAILLGGRELVRGLRGTRTFHLFHLFCKFPWIFAWFGFVGVALLVCLFLLAFAFGEICFLSSLIPVVDRQCLALVRQCRKKKKNHLRKASKRLEGGFEGSVNTFQIHFLDARSCRMVLDAIIVLIEEFSCLLRSF